MTDQEYMSIVKLFNCMVNTQVTMIYHIDKIFSPQVCSEQIIRAKFYLLDQIKAIKENSDEQSKKEKEGDQDEHFDTI